MSKVFMNQIILLLGSPFILQLLVDFRLVFYLYRQAAARQLFRPYPPSLPKVCSANKQQAL